MKLKKRGLSPVVATMLLIVIVIIIGLIIFLWLRGMNQEAITKFDGTNVKIICGEVSFDADYTNSDKMLYLVNTGNVPIYKMKVKKIWDGGHETITLEDNWPEFGLTPGGTFSGSLGSETSGLEKIFLIPVLIGHSKKGDLAHTCDEKDGYEIIVI